MSVASALGGVKRPELKWLRKPSRVIDNRIACYYIPLVAKKTKVVKPWTSKKIDSAIHAAWSALASGVQINILDINKVYRHAQEACQAAFSTCSDGATLEAVTVRAINDSVTASIIKYRTN